MLCKLTIVSRRHLVSRKLFRYIGFEDYEKFKIEERVKGKTANEIIDYLTEKICTQRANWNRDGDNNIRIEETGDISEFLEGVMVHPLAPQWYVDIIRDICETRKIKFDGQSEIYILK